MERIFDKAYFGKAYKTRDGRKAIYINIENSVFRKRKGKSHYLIIEDTPWCSEPYNVCGFIEDETNFLNDPRDIVSEWTEETNEEELEKLAHEYVDNSLPLLDGDAISCFKAGYRKALIK